MLQPHRSIEDRSTEDRSVKTDRLGKWLIAVVVAALVLYFAGRIVLLAFAGVLLAVFLSSLSGWVSERSRLSYGWSLVAVVGAILVATGLAAWRLQFVVVEQFQEFSRTLPESLDALRNRMEQANLDGWIPQEIPSASAVVQQPGMLSSLTGVASGTLAVAVDVLVVLFVGLYGAAEPRVYQRGIRHLVPKPHRERADEVLQVVVRTLRWWIVGKLCSMAIVGAAIGIGLWLLGIRTALLLGLIAAVFELVPNFGPVIAAIPAILIAWAESPQSALYVAILFVTVQLAESYFVLPLIQRETVQTPPALVILAIILMATLAGALGALIATPLLAVLIVIVKMLYVEGRLGDETVEAAGETARR